MSCLRANAIQPRMDANGCRDGTDFRFEAGLIIEEAALSSRTISAADCLYSFASTHSVEEATVYAGTLTSLYALVSIGGTAIVARISNIDNAIELGFFTVLIGSSITMKPIEFREILRNRPDVRKSEIRAMAPRKLQHFNATLPQFPLGPSLADATLVSPFPDADPLFASLDHMTVSN